MENLYFGSIIIWGFVLITALVGMFWKPAQYLTVIAAAVMVILCYKAYRRFKKNK